MPKFIGNTIDGAPHDLDDNTIGALVGLTRLTYAQARLMPAEVIHTSLDTSDKGSRGVLAKRWFRFFAAPRDVLANVDSTVNMIVRAKHTLRQS